MGDVFMKIPEYIKMLTINFRLSSVTGNNRFLSAVSEYQGQ
jgi:hypothetical protein